MWSGFPAPIPMMNSFRMLRCLVEMHQPMGRTARLRADFAVSRIGNNLVDALLAQGKLNADRSGRFPVPERSSPTPRIMRAAGVSYQDAFTSRPTQPSNSQPI